MTIPVDVAAALVRLSTGAPTGYNNGTYNAGTNPYGFGGIGYITLLFALTDDVDLVTNYVATLSTTILALEPNITNLAALTAEISLLGAITSSISTLAGISANVTTVAGIASNVTAVAGALTNLSTIIANLSALNVVATNIAEILAAQTYAATATTQAGIATAAAASAKRVVSSFVFAAGTGAVDPGTGKWAINHATPSSGTIWTFNLTANSGGDVTALLDLLDDSTSTANRGLLYLVDLANAANWIVGKITGANASITGARNITVTYVALGGTLTAGREFSLYFAATGNKGTDGAGSGTVTTTGGVGDLDIAVFDTTSGTAIKSGLKKLSDFNAVAFSGISDALTEGSAKLLLTTAERAKLTAIEALADVTTATKIAAATHGVTGKTTPINADEFGIIDTAASNSLKVLTWTNLKAAMFTAWGALVAAGTSKTTPVDADSLDLSDSAASDATKKLSWANLKATLKTYLDTLYAPIARTGFSANKNGTNQTGVVSATYTKVTFPTEAWDTGNFFASSTWTPPVGKYRISAAVSISTTNMVDASIVAMKLYKNGAADAMLDWFITAKTDPLAACNASGSCLIDSNGTDTWELYIYVGGAGNKTFDGTLGLTYFQAEMI